MAGLGHIAVGIAVGRLRSRGDPPRVVPLAMAGYAVLAVLPDVDVSSFRLGIPYDSEFGHRGAVHSLVFALAIGVIVGVFQRLRGRPWAASGAVAAAVVASHGLLDAMTNGGLGVSLFWPFTDHRYFLPWRMIPVSPMARQALSPRGLHVALTELWMFAPFWLYALWPRRERLYPVTVSERQPH